MIIYLTTLRVFGPMVIIATWIAIALCKALLGRRHRIRVGDTCAKCLKVIQPENNHKMQCGHALHKKCFNEIRLIRTTCLICHARVIYTQPGDCCVICCEDMETEDMKYLRCGHAFHNDCINDPRNKCKFCPQCLARF